MKEALVNLTFKTNRKCMEIFAVLVSWQGSCFMSQICFQRGCTGTSQPQRQNPIHLFLIALYKKIALPRSRLFSTDKDVWKMSAISATYFIAPLLWLWNTKRAMKRKIEELCRNGFIKIQNNCQQMCFRCIDMPFFGPRWPTQLLQKLSTLSQCQKFELS